MSERAVGHLIPKIVAKINATLPIGYHADLASKENPDIAKDHIRIIDESTQKPVKRLYLDPNNHTYREYDGINFEE